MTRNSHHTNVDRQFGNQAQAYVTSQTHAQGPDLQRLGDVLRAAPAARALDLGCGGGHVAYTIAPLVQSVVAYDLSQGMLDAVAGEAAKRNLKNIEIVRGAAESLPFPDGHFDFICTRYSAHHWRDLHAGLREARRVLQPGGRMVCIDITSPEDPLHATFLQTVEMLRDPSHVCDYAVSEWESALAAAGFTIDRITPGRLSMSFAAWIDRMRPPQLHVDAIHSLCKHVAGEVLDYFALNESGRIDMDNVLIEAARPGAMRLLD